jgi:integrase
VRTGIATAAFIGLRAGEIQGVRWENFSGDELQIKRSVWSTQVGDTKNEERECAIPVIPLLREMLEAHGKLNPPNGPDYIFSVELHSFRPGLTTHLNALGV